MGIANHLFHLSTLARKHGRSIEKTWFTMWIFFWKHAPKGGFWYRQTKTPWETLF